MRKFCNYLGQELNLTTDQIDVIYYGLFVIITNTISYISVLTFGFIMNELYDTFILLMYYSPMRMILGGFHCKTALKCFICFNAMFIVSILLIPYLKKVLYLKIIVSVSIILIFLLVLKYEKKYKKGKLIIITIYFVLLILLNKTSIVLYLSIIINVFLYLLAFIKHNRVERK